MVFPGVVLHSPSKEGLSEEEARQPEHIGLTGVVPILQAHKVKVKL